MWARDRVVEGYISTTATGTGKRADAVYLERIAVSAIVTMRPRCTTPSATPNRSPQYRAALDASGGRETRALHGEYLASTRLGRAGDAEQAFGRIVAQGIASQQLGVKFLFSPNGTAFWPDPKVSGVYPMWLRQIARESSAAKVCMTIAGHTSRTGSEAFNDMLSLQRAAAIRLRLVADAPALAGRIKTVGLGYRENIVGSGTDDATDALDRRVEFRITPARRSCGARSRRRCHRAIGAQQRLQALRLDAVVALDGPGSPATPLRRRRRAAGA